MKFTIEKTILENNLKALSPFVNKRDNSNITSCIKMEVNGYDLILSATDYEYGLKTNIENMGNIEDGECNINLPILISSISRLKAGEVEITLNNDILTIKQKRSKVNLSTFDDEFPKLYEDVENMNSIKIDCLDLNNSIKSVISGIDPNNPKVELGGVLFDIKDNKFNVVSTDTKCLIVNNIDTNLSVDDKIIIPKKSIVEIQKLLTDDTIIYYDDTNIIIDSNNSIMFSRMINGKFPDYNRVIPTESKYNFSLNANEINEAIKCVTGLNNNVTMTFSSNEIKVESNEDKNNSETFIDIDLDIDEDFTIIFDSKFMTNFLNTIVGDFSIKMNDVNLPILLEKDNLKTIVMPVVQN